MTSWKKINRTRPLPYPTVKCYVCHGLGWEEDTGSTAADGLQTKCCTKCGGEGRVAIVKFDTLMRTL